MKEKLCWRYRVYYLLFVYRLRLFEEAEDGGVRDLERVRVRVLFGESRRLDRPLLVVVRLRDLDRDRDLDLECERRLFRESRRESSPDLADVDFADDNLASDERDNGGVVFELDLVSVDDLVDLELLCDFELDLESSPRLDVDPWPDLLDGVLVIAFSCSFSFSLAFHLYL